MNEILIITASAIALMLVSQIIAPYVMSIGANRTYPEFEKEHDVKVFQKKGANNTGIVGFGRVIFIADYVTDQAQAYALLMHEVEHIKKKHNAVRILLKTANSALFLLLLLLSVHFQSYLLCAATAMGLLLVAKLMNLVITRQEYAADKGAVMNECGAYSLVQALTESRLRLSYNGYPSIKNRMAKIVDAQIKKGEQEFNNTQPLLDAVGKSNLTGGAL